MVRLGIIKGSGLKLFGPAKFGSTYVLKTNKEIQDMYDKLLKQFQTQPHGPFYDVKSLIGERQAQILSKKGELIMPDPYHNHPSPSPSSSRHRLRISPKKRKRPVIEEEESEENENYTIDISL